MGNLVRTPSFMSNACETKQKEEKTHRVNADFVPNQEIVERRARPPRKRVPESMTQGEVCSQRA